MDLAKRFNQRFGTTYEPREILEIESDWFDAYRAIERLPGLRKENKKFDAIKNRIKSEHPSYGARMARQKKRPH